MSQPRQIELPSEEIDAVGCFLEYLYTGDYFPRKVPGQRQLEVDPTLPKVDESGEQLLKHARVYTLAEKFQVPNLRTLASSKIHCVNSTAKGEIAYARYVYAYTSDADTTIRAPVANFWANRSHTLRAEAEPEFRGLCLEYPQFGYDVLSKLNFCSQSFVAYGPLLIALQPASWTRSSSARPMPSCTLPAAARASDLATARSERSEYKLGSRLARLHEMLPIDICTILGSFAVEISPYISGGQWEYGRHVGGLDSAHEFLCYALGYGIILGAKICRFGLAS